MPGRKPSRPRAARMLATPHVEDVAVGRALADVDQALREEQRDPKLPRTGAPGDIYYRAADGRIVRLPIGNEGDHLVVREGFPVWESEGPEILI